MRVKVFGMFLLILLFSSQITHAQSGYVELGGEGNFHPDPYITTVLTGNTTNVTDYAANCLGSVSEANDFSLTWLGEETSLYIGAISQANIGLLILEVSGVGTQSQIESVHCRDADETSTPELLIPVHSGVRYVVMVSNVLGANPTSAYLFIGRKELQLDVFATYYSTYNSDTQPTTPPSNPADVGLNLNGTPNYGQVTIASGFQPDPMMQTIASGGPIDVNGLGISGCYGWAAPNPDYRITLTTNSNLLRLFFVGSNNVDTTMIVHTPGNQWVCNDDSFFTTNPTVDIQNAVAGVYDIWIANYEAGLSDSGTFYITELVSLDPTTVSTSPNPSGTSSSTLNVGGTPNFGSVSLASNFQPDPASVSFSSGGDVDANLSLNLQSCRGFVSANPDYQLNLTTSSNFLRFYFLASNGGDTTLIVHTPTDQWFCNDDSYTGLNPTVDIISATPGIYQIWVGTFVPGGGVPGTLHITELDANHP